MKKQCLLFVLTCLALEAHAAERSYALVDGMTLTSQSLAQALADYVSADCTAKGGSFIIEDPVARTLVKLKPTKLDDGSHLHQLGDNSFLSWGEFVTERGDAFMLDFYFEWKQGRWILNGPLSIYSKNKLKRYAWDEKGHFMKRLELPKKAGKR